MTNRSSLLFIGVESIRDDPAREKHLSVPRFAGEALSCLSVLTATRPADCRANSEAAPSSPWATLSLTRLESKSPERFSTLGSSLKGRTSLKHKGSGLFLAQEGPCHLNDGPNGWPVASLMSCPGKISRSPWILCSAVRGVAEGRYLPRLMGLGHSQ